MPTRETSIRWIIWAEFEWEFIQPAKAENPQRAYPFVIEFSLHCFTRAPNTRLGEELRLVDSALQYSDSRETRIFSFDRYSLSFKLPDIAKSLGERPCFHAGRGNFLVPESVEVDRSGGREEYEMYFRVSKTGRNLLRLYVQTAYVREREPHSPQPGRKRINFFLTSSPA